MLSKLPTHKKKHNTDQQHESLQKFPQKNTYPKTNEQQTLDSLEGKLLYADGCFYVLCFCSFPLAHFMLRESTGSFIRKIYFISTSFFAPLLLPIYFFFASIERNFLIKKVSPPIPIDGNFFVVPTFLLVDHVCVGAYVYNINEINHFGKQSHLYIFSGFCINFNEKRPKHKIKQLPKRERETEQDCHLCIANLVFHRR